MSLDALRKLRRRGEKPWGLVKIVIGKPAPYGIERDVPEVISVTSQDQPDLMDWRAVFGLPLALFVCNGSDELAERVLTAVVAAGAQLVGAAWSDVATSTDEAIKPVLRRMWEQLCP
jgi:hypothetical protein